MGKVDINFPSSWLDINEMNDVKENTRLVAADRCDVCGAQAYIRVELESGDLLFCAHHGNANKEKLQPLTVNWYDQSEELSQK